MEPITIRNLTFAYPGQQNLFKNCNLDLESSWKLGLLGRNGRGKTTLFNIFQHRLDYKGIIQCKLDFIGFPLIISPTLTDFAIDAINNVLPELEDSQWKIERELNRLHTDPGILYQPYRTLSGGEKTKLQLAALFALDSHYLLLDEPTNHLDQLSRQQVATYLKNKKSGFIITSHDRTFLDKVIDHYLVIEQHQLILEHGNYSTYFKQKQRRDQEALKNNQRLKNEIKQLKQKQHQRQQWAQEAEKEKQNNAHADKGFIGAKAAKMMKKSTGLAQRLNDTITKKEGMINNREQIIPLSLNYQPSRHELLLSVKDLTLSYYQCLFKPVSFVLKSNDQLALIGENGIGKSSLLQAIQSHFTGEVNGQINLDPQLKISLVRQDYSGNHGFLKDFAEDNHLNYESLLNILFKLGFNRDAFKTPIEQMSMGQQKRVELAKSLVEPAQLYIWDEPLNYLDSYNQQQLIDLIKKYRPPLLFIEHDQKFIKEVANKQIKLTSK